MSLDAINKDDYGYTVELTYEDTDTETAADISAYSTAQYLIFRDPHGNETTATASYKTDGSDGVVEYTIASGVIDEAGQWAVRIKVTGASSEIRSEWLEFEVGE